MPMHALIPLVLTLLLSLTLVAVIMCDTARYTIPNELNIAIVLFWGLGLLLMPHVRGAATAELAAAGLVLAGGLVLFALGLVGGGDVKLLAALTLWTGGGQGTLQFLFLTAIAGGVLVVIVLLLRMLVTPVLRRVRMGSSVPRVLLRGQPVPYGIAIAAAFLWLIASGGVLR